MMKRKWISALAVMTIVSVGLCADPAKDPKEQATELKAKIETIKQRVETLKVRNPKAAEIWQKRLTDTQAELVEVEKLIAKEKEPEPEKPKAVLPETAKLDTATKEIHDIFKDEFAKTSNTAKQELARQLLTAGQQAKEANAECYALLKEAVTLAAACGDAETVTTALAELTARFQGDFTALQLEAAEKLILTATGKPAVQAMLANLFYELSQTAFQKDDLTTAGKYMLKAVATANNAQDPALAKQIQGYQMDLQFYQLEYAKVVVAKKTLETTPTDATALAIVGRYTSLFKQQWDDGFKMLAQGDQPALKTIAELELMPERKPEGTLELIDKWWEHGQTNDTQPRVKRIAWERALAFYEDLGDAVAGLAKSKYDKRKLDYSRAALALGWTQREVELASLINLDKHVISGTWKKEDGVYNGTAVGGVTLLEFARAPQGDYELNLQFIPHGNRYAILTLPVGDTVAQALIFSRGRLAVVLTSPRWSVPVAQLEERTQLGHFISGVIRNPQPVRLIARVQTTDKQATISLRLNGTEVLNWKGERSLLGAPIAHKPKTAGVPALGTEGGEGVALGSAKLTMLTGKMTNPAAKK
ncbi:MAG: hypothetical protein WCJ97_08490 [Phycisphaerae bacterium]